MCGKCDGLPAPGPEFLVTISGASASKSTKSSRLAKRKSKWSHEENKFLWEFYIRMITSLPACYMETIHQLWVDKGMREFCSQ